VNVNEIHSLCAAKCRGICPLQIIHCLSAGTGSISQLTVLSVGALCFTARAILVPRNPERGVAVVFAPWTAPETAMARAVEAGARFVRFGGYGFIAVVAADDRDYAARAMAAGAWLVADPELVAACLAAFAAKASRP
jgi:hypothetical protein